MTSTELSAGNEESTVAELAGLIVGVRRAQDQGREWLLSRISATGEPVGTQTRQSCRLPWTLAVAGERAAAASNLAWLERTVMTSDGDLREGSAREGFTTAAATYGLAMIAIGAAYLERDDLVRKIIATIRDWQDPVTGGAFSERPEVRQLGLQDLHDTAQLGLAALATHQHDMAKGAYRWIKELYRLQPELPTRLYTRTTSAGLFTEPPPNLLWGSVIDFTKPRQAFFNPGLAAAFLARYALETGDAEALQLGSRFLDLSADGTPAQFDYNDSKQICKFGWGAALMDVADPSGGHLRHLVQMAHWFIDSQLPDGRWQNSQFLNPNPTEGDDQEITAEFALHLGTILTALGSRLGRAA